MSKVVTSFLLDNPSGLKKNCIQACMTASAYRVISKGVENRVFRHNLIFKHKCMYKQSILTK